jgi:ribosomal-protein-alanine N-acetyltransferase
MKLLPIKKSLEENKIFTDHPDCQESIFMSVEFYNKVGYEIPWICYYAEKDGQLVGSAAFKGKPVNGRVEIAYGTFPKFQNQGIGSEICQTLVNLARETDISVTITARTLPEHNYSTKILQRNGFELSGPVIDPEDGEVWEWVYKGK